MNIEMLLSEAKDLQTKICEVREDLHRHPELGFDLQYTKAVVLRELAALGIEAAEVGQAGVTAVIGPATGKCILLRADMDALPLQEEADIEFKSEIPGRMHGCGHDMHTAMLLSAAKLLKAHESELKGQVKLEFQPAEEIFRGSLDMVNNGLLENPHVDAAFMLHVMAAMPAPTGSLLVPAVGGTMLASCEQYHITVRGKGGHGSAPHNSIDPITAAAHIHLALQEINSREINGHDFGVFTTCKFTAGETSNVIPDEAHMYGTIRTTDPENKVGELIRTRMKEIATGVGMALRCEVNVEFFDFCPCLVLDPILCAEGMRYLTELAGDKAVDYSALTNNRPNGGSEDFAFVSHKVPTLAVFLAAGNPSEGYLYGQHNSKVRFDDSFLYLGAAAYVQIAMRWLEEHA